MLGVDTKVYVGAASAMAGIAGSALGTASRSQTVLAGLLGEREMGGRCE